jgi:mannose/fructose/N-acetylgalactosamine-specific phosphotransferase system component IIC
VSPATPPLGHELALLFWGTLVGLDLVSVPQMMVARPLVAGTVAGLLIGDLPAGLALGILFELFQYDILPVGAVRYPEYGPATVAAVSAAHLVAGAPGLGLGGLVGLVTALAGGLSLDLLRRINSRAIHAADRRLETGDPRTLVHVHAAAIARDALRGALVTAFGLGLAWFAASAFVLALPARAATTLGIALAAGAVAAGLAAGASGTLRTVGSGPNLRWFALGLLGAAAVVWLV